MKKIIARELGAFPVFAALAFTALTFAPRAARAQQASLNRKIAYAWISDLNNHDTIALAGLYADSATLISPNWEGTKTGPSAVREIYRRYFAGTPDLSHQLTHLIATDSALVIEYQSTGTLSNPEANTPAYMKGKKYTLQNCTRMDIRNGRIIRQVNYFDQVAFLRQVGFFDQHP